jgi:hypothetical protein
VILLISRKCTIIHLILHDPRGSGAWVCHLGDLSLSWTNRVLLGLETAQAFWGLLLPHGLEGGALSHTKGDDDEDVNMDGDEEGWKPEYVQWWFDFLNEKGGKGISKDTWVMVRPSLESPFDYSLTRPFYRSSLTSCALLTLILQTMIWKVRYSSLSLGYNRGRLPTIFRGLAIDYRRLRRMGKDTTIGGSITVVAPSQSLFISRSVLIPHQFDS